MKSRLDIIEIDGQSIPVEAMPAGQMSTRLAGRPWLAVHWRCCGVYSRIYRNAQATAYDGRCPRCLKPVHVNVGPGGTSSRFFEAT